MRRILHLLTVLLITSEDFSQLSEADEYYNRGCQNLRQENYQGAMEYFNWAIELDLKHYTGE
ncbi:MAG: hypothetical protein A2X05_03360 [Bacteroidetes bacterium GWE2_41_25]|nr:MAG: hypothetical protein A2X03_16060 [Bacteroidetes bacterium GWA2_40_15]OFX91816.1 MAG: hypothetical protein A2X05_03360 [Bacteroidetes bacterium GWE2_41_25]OFX94051.1 MAG: hypothetical protein A2X06_14970 [Bacteroidetes bacterium GWC2_40_22]HBH85540.1 hypothetical protein [Bacteroidales bacterium]HCU20179.1 hypothetical protein [Bacteroidales bacterium]